MILNDSFTSQQQTFTFILIVPLCIIQKNPFVSLLAAASLLSPSSLNMSFDLLKLLLSSLVIRWPFGTASVTSLGSVGLFFDVIFNCAVKCLGRQRELRIPLALGVPSARSSDFN